jgi:hypothetical protein
MPTRRTSPRRTATRPNTASSVGYHVEDDDEPGPGRLAAAAPWLALLSLVLAVAAIAFVALRGGSDLTPCRSAAWAAVPDAKALPAGWMIGSTDLNANGLTVSIVGPTPAEEDAQSPVVYASVTCYGNGAGTALAENRKGAEAAGATITDRTTNGEAYDVANPSTGSRTTLFRVGDLVGQVADAGSAAPDELASITKAVAAAMGNETAAGSDPVAPTDAAVGSEEPLGSASGSDEPGASPFAPELEAVLPTELKDTPLTIQSDSAAEIFGDDPGSRALGARIRALGGTLEKLQVAQAYDDTGAIEASIVAFRLPGADLPKLQAAIEETWLSAGDDGVTSTPVSLGGKTLTKIDYGDEGTTEYVYGKSDYVVVIETSDESLVAEIATKLQ